MPKEHHGSSLEVDEEANRELSSLKKTIRRYFESDIGRNTQTVFVETFITGERDSHMVIDAVAVPLTEDSLDDIELYFRKTFQEGDSEWKLSTTSKQIIDTKPLRGNIQRCFPSKGQFSFAHIDLNGEGGVAHLIEDTKKFTKFKALETLANGPLGITIVNVRQAASREVALENAKVMRERF